MKSRLIILSLAIFVMVVLLAVPWPGMHLAAPAWDVTVVDLDGKPVANVRVSEWRQDWSCETEMHESILITDAKGHVQFPSVRVHRKMAECAHVTVEELGAGVHASLGDHVSINVGGLVCVPDGRGYCIDWTGSPGQMNTRVTLQYVQP